MKQKTVWGIFVFSCLTGLALGQSGINGHVKCQLLAQPRVGASEALVAQTLAAQGARTHHIITPLNVHVILAPDSALDRIQNALIRTGVFTFVEPDFLARGGDVPNDPDLPMEWHLTTIQAVKAWSTTLGNNTPIAIIDSGVDPTHEDLASKLVAGWSFLTGTSVTSDVLGHGTAVAGTAAAATNNGIGVAGIARLNPIMPLVVLDSTNYASYSNIASAITYAADHGARVMNISIVGPSASSTLQSAATYASYKVPLIFPAPGNPASSPPAHPARSYSA